jgi:protein gp37
MSLVVSGISWTKYARSALWGCTSCSAGCRLCYAAQRTFRFGKAVPAYAGLAVKNGKGRFAFTGIVRYLPHHLNALLKEKEPSLFFCNEFSDLLHEKVPLWVTMEHIKVAATAYWHEVRFLTKRDERLPEMDNAVLAQYKTWPANVWIGLSVCQSSELDKIQQLQKTRAAIRWLSVEPWLSEPSRPLRQTHPRLRDRLHGLQWIVIGGESGSRINARVMTLDDTRYWIEEAQAAGCAVWVKQLGTALAFQLGVDDPRQENEHGNARAGAVMNRWPEDIRIQQLPETPKRKRYAGEQLVYFKQNEIAWESDTPGGLVHIRGIGNKKAA